jgi:alpha(1,3/1,4) fucosyltransferase
MKMMGKNMNKKIMGIFLFMLGFEAVAENKTIYIVPFAGYGEELFDPKHIMHSDDLNLPFRNLKQKIEELGYRLKVTDLEDPLEDFFAILVFHRPSKKALNKLKKYPLNKRILLLMEPPTTWPDYYDQIYHEYFGKIFITIDDYVDNKKYFKLYFPQPTLQMGKLVPLNDKKLCTLIATDKSSNHELELYSERRKAIAFFEKKAPQEFDLYGYNWNKTEFSSYRGKLDSKHNTLRKYAFCICYENMRNVNGYISEKIFDAFKAGCVPVYWGASNITNFVPASCFIDKRNFESYEILYEFLKEMPEDTYNEYLRNINNFLDSDQARLFSSEYFVDMIVKHLEINKTNSFWRSFFGD